MADEDVTQDAPMEIHSIPFTDTGTGFSTLPTSVQVAPADAVAAFMDWLCSRPQQAGPFGVYWSAEHGQSLVKEFCEKQGW